MCCKCSECNLKVEVKLCLKFYMFWIVTHLSYKLRKYVSSDTILAVYKVQIRKDLPVITNGAMGILLMSKMAMKREQENLKIFHFQF